MKMPASAPGIHQIHSAPYFLLCKEKVFVSTCTIKSGRAYQLLHNEEKIVVSRHTIEVTGRTIC
jgi:hypothetical protein